MIKQKGLETIKQHAKEILEKRIKTLKENEGRQTPFKGNPVFKAQHATATCCRSCIEKWHKIPRNKILSDDEINYLSKLIINWVSSQTNARSVL